MPLYEYRCPSCATAFTRLERHAADGKPATCPSCGTAAVRTFAPFAVHRRAEPVTPRAPRPAAADTLCHRYPHVPLLCHMEPAAAERWIAKAEGHEQQYLEREACRQEEAVRKGEPPPPAPAPAHDDHFGHVHAHAATPAGQHRASDVH